MMLPSPTRPMSSLHNPNPNPEPKTRTIAFTTPNNYADRLSLLLHRHNFTPLWCPTVIVQPTPATTTSLRHHLSSLHLFSALAFTSRSGISAVSAAVLPPPATTTSDFHHPLLVGALGRDADLLTPDFLSKLSPNLERIRVLTPSDPTPSGLVKSLGPGLGRSVLCPVPRVLGLEEPNVVPDFLSDLGRMGWVPVRADAYETRWAGPDCAGKLVGFDGVVDGLVFTSTAEVEGLLKGLEEIGLGWVDVSKMWPKLFVAAHGPVTASGAQKLGVRVDVISSKYGSFEGVVEALNDVFIGN